jgi:hypothetical protein
MVFRERFAMIYDWRSNEVCGGVGGIQKRVLPGHNVGIALKLMAEKMCVWLREVHDLEMTEQVLSTFAHGPNTMRACDNLSMNRASLRWW